MRTGVFGGTFNPLHFGHLLAADDVRRRLQLDRVLFIPACRPTHKRSGTAPYRHRSAMTRLGIKGHPGFELCTIEEQLPGPSWTVDTLDALHAALPRESLYLILGSDQYNSLDSWHAPEHLTRHARLVVMERPGARKPRLCRYHDPRRVRFLPVIAVDISGATIRARLARSKSVQYMLPLPVLRHLRRHRLYA